MSSSVETAYTKYKVKDLSLAEWGRKEIGLAEFDQHPLGTGGHERATGLDQQMPGPDGRARDGGHLCGSVFHGMKQLFHLRN